MLQKLAGEATARQRRQMLGVIEELARRAQGSTASETAQAGEVVIGGRTVSIAQAAQRAREVLESADQPHSDPQKETDAATAPADANGVQSAESARNNEEGGASPKQQTSSNRTGQEGSDSPLAQQSVLRQEVQVPGMPGGVPSTAFLLAQAARMSVIRSNFYHRATLVAAISGVEGIQEAAAGEEQGGGMGARRGSKRRLDRRRAHSRNTAAKLRRESLQIRNVLSQHAAGAAFASGRDGGSAGGESDRDSVLHSGSARSRGGSGGLDVAYMGGTSARETSPHMAATTSGSSRKAMQSRYFSQANAWGDSSQVGMVRREVTAPAHIRLPQASAQHDGASGRQYYSDSSSAGPLQGPPSRPAGKSRSVGGGMDVG